MCRLWKAQSTLKIYINMYLSIILILIIFGKCNSTVLHVIEGEVVQLNFPYPCDITKITLQHGAKAPFYNSADPQSNTMPPRYELANHSKLGNDNSCHLQLTINPVSRNDEGTYILSVYNHSELLPEYPSIGLRVSYPPGKASCGRSSTYLVGEWIKLYCEAPKGNIAGQIICYQNNRRLPPLTTNVENGGILRQEILARVENYSVICCSSTYDQMKVSNQCKDSGWDPILNIPLTDIHVHSTDSLTTTLPTQHTCTTPQTFKPDCIIPSSDPTVACKKPLGLSVTLGFLILVLVIILAVYLVKVRENKTLTEKLGKMDDLYKLGEEKTPKDEEA